MQPGRVSWTGNVRRREAGFDLTAKPSVHLLVLRKLGRVEHMRAQRIWVHNGLMEPSQAEAPMAAAEEERLLHGGSVRLTTGHLGTEVRWVVNSPCVASLFKVMQWLPTVRAPYILRFFAMGWFEEVYRDASFAARRIEQVLARGDRHFTSRVFIKHSDLESDVVPEILKHALQGSNHADDFAVDCRLDESSNQFFVTRIGSQSAIGRIWGTYTSSHPCQSAGSYGDQLNATYEDVLRSNRPRYDHVLAALRLPDNALHWVPYHRVVMPTRHSNGERGVTVVSQVARVDIQVL
jgi:hypothetical protein